MLHKILLQLNRLYKLLRQDKSKGMQSIDCIKNILYIIHEERREINRNCIIILIPVVTLKEKLGTPII